MQAEPEEYLSWPLRGLWKKSMSTKVYTAYRIKKGFSLFDFVRDVRPLAREEARRLLKIVIQGMLGRSENPPSSWGAAYFELRKSYAEQAGSLYRDIWNLDVTISFHEHKGRFYLIPYSDFLMAKTLDFLASHPMLEEYGYWNNTDRPEGIGLREWNVRGRIWDEICKTWDNQLVLDVVSVIGFYTLDLALEPKIK